MPSNPNTDYITPAVQALATLLAANWDFTGHVYDQTSLDPSPDALIKVLADPPDVVFHVTEARLGLAGESTIGQIGRKVDLYTCIVSYVFGAWQGQRGQSYQASARRVPQQIRGIIDGHNTVSGAAWKAYVDQAYIGPRPDALGALWYVVEVPVTISLELQVTQAS